MPRRQSSSVISGSCLPAPAVAAAGVVNQDVDFAELLDRRLGERVDLRRDGDVGRHDQAFAAGFFDGVGGLVELRLGARGRDDVGARLGELHRHRAAETAAGAGDDGDFAVELERIENHGVTSIERGFCQVNNIAAALRKMTQGSGARALLTAPKGRSYIERKRIVRWR